MRYLSVKGIPKSTMAETTIIIKPVDVETFVFKFIFKNFNYIIFIILYSFIFINFYLFQSSIVIFLINFYLHVYLHHFRPNFILSHRTNRMHKATQKNPAFY